MADVRLFLTINHSSIELGIIYALAIILLPFCATLDWQIVKLMFYLCVRNVPVHYLRLFLQFPFV